jgi:hypothetical protein
MKIVLLLIVLFSSFSIYGQSNSSTDTFIIKVEPVKPRVLLTRKKSKISKLKFFRSFRHEMIKSSDIIYKVKINGEPTKIKNYSKIASKVRK